MTINSVYNNVVDKTLGIFLKNYNVVLTDHIREMIFFKKEESAINFRLNLLIKDPEQCFRENLTELLDSLSNELGISDENGLKNIVKGSVIHFLYHIEKKDTSKKCKCEPYFLGIIPIFSLLLCYYLM